MIPRRELGDEALPTSTYLASIARTSRGTSAVNLKSSQWCGPSRRPHRESAHFPRAASSAPSNPPSVAPPPFALRGNPRKDRSFGPKMASFGSRPLPLNGGGNGLVLLPNHGGRSAAAAAVAVFCRVNGVGAGRGDFRLRFPARVGMREGLVGLEKGRGLQATGKGGIFGKEKRVEDGDGADSDADAAVQAAVHKNKKVVESKTKVSSSKAASAEADKDASSPTKISRTFSSNLGSAEPDKDVSHSTKSSRTSSSNVRSSSGVVKGRYNGSTASNVSVQSTETMTTKARHFGIPGIWPHEAKESGDSKEAKPAVTDTPGLAKDAEAARKDTEHKKAEQQAEPEKEKVDAPPLAGVNVMNVILVAAECAPWSKTGGLGDVAGALPKALVRRGHRVMVVVPKYGHYAEPKDLGVRKRYKVAGQDMEVSYHHAYIDGVDFVFLDSPIFSHRENNIYGGERVDILKRMILFCKAAVEVPWHVPCGGVCYGDGNLAFIANDWHTALLPVYLKAYYRDNGLMKYTRSVLVIHNIAHQGRGPMEDFSHTDLPEHYMDLFKLYDPVGGEHFNIFAAGLKTADRIVTVSHGYAWELKTSEGGWGLHEIINENNRKLRGIVNGIDTEDWNPELDVHLQSDGYTNYSAEALQAGKAKCKAALQRELGLPVREEVPLIGFIGRLDQQKGVDLIAGAMPWIVGQDAQLVMLGTGRDDLEEMLRRLEREHNEKVRGRVGFSVRTAHRITAGADVLLMPSRFEPCGLNQLYAMRYGTVPVVHAVGGLRDTVIPFDPFGESGYGWTFDRAESNKLINALGNCLSTYWNHKESWIGLQLRGMAQDLSWDNAAKNYEEALVEAKYQW